MPPGHAQVRTKVVIRNLPPNLPQEPLLNAVHEVLPPTTYDWVCYVPGKVSSKVVKPSRLYLHLLKQEDVAALAQAFQGKVFVNDKGAQYRATIEYAPFQRVPGAAKPDKRENTIQQDNDYVQFCQRLQNDNKKAGPVDLPDPQGAREAPPVVTPLMQALIDKHTPAHLRPPTANAADARKVKIKTRERSGGPSAGPSGGTAKGPKGAEKAGSKGGVNQKGDNISKGKQNSVSKGGSKEGASSNPAAANTSKSAAKSAPIPTKPVEKPTSSSNAGATASTSNTKADSSGDASASQSALAKSSDSAADRPARRVRAGFQVYQPKRRGQAEGEGGS